MGAGGVLAGRLPERAGRWLGAGILIAVGAWAVAQMALGARREAAARGEAAPPEAAGGKSAAAPRTEGTEGAPRPGGEAAQAGKPAPVAASGPRAGGPGSVPRAAVPAFRLMLRIRRTPSLADVDRSGTISAAEAVLLGLALSLDSLGAGFGAALVGFPPAAAAAAIGAACALCMFAGAKLGLVLAGARWLGKLALLPGCILIVMGFLKMM